MIRFIIALLVLAASVGPAFASLTRVAGLGVDTWMIEEEESLIWLNPARVNDCTDTVWGEWTGGTPAVAAVPMRMNNTAITNAWGGISKKLGIMDITGALFVGQPYGGILAQAGADVNPLTGAGIGSSLGAATAINSTITGGAAMTAKAPLGKYDLFIAMPLPKPLPELNAGVRVSVASDSESNNEDNLTKPTAAALDTEVEDDFSSSDMEISAGVQIEDLGPVSVLDVAVGMNMLKCENTNTGVTYVNPAGTVLPRTTNEYSFKMDNGMNLTLDARGVLPMEGYSLIGYLQYQKQDISNVFTQQDDGDASGDYQTGADNNVVQNREQKNTNMLFGLAMNKNLSEKTLLIAGISMNSITNTHNGSVESKFLIAPGVADEYKWEQKTTRIPVNIAVEHEISKVVTSRIGFDKNISNKQTISFENPTLAWNAVTSAYAETALVTDEDTDDNNTGIAAVTIGLGLKPLKDMVIDAVMRQQLMFTGGFLVSGIPETLAAQVTATLRY